MKTRPPCHASCSTEVAASQHADVKLTGFLEEIDEELWRTPAVRRRGSVGLDKDVVDGMPFEQRLR
jgi:hypothetical protein